MEDVVAGHGIARVAYSPAEVADMLGLSVDKIYELVRSGQIPHVRFGRKIVVPAKPFFDWLNSTALEEQLN